MWRWAWLLMIVSAYGEMSRVARRVGGAVHASAHRRHDGGGDDGGERNRAGSPADHPFNL
eukprot:256350-Pleurochrysis_carterae.AAC.3